MDFRDVGLVWFSFYSRSLSSSCFSVIIMFDGFECFNCKINVPPSESWKYRVVTPYSGHRKIVFCCQECKEEWLSNHPEWLARINPKSGEDVVLSMLVKGGGEVLLKQLRDVLGGNVRYYVDRLEKNGLVSISRERCNRKVFLRKKP